MYGWLGTTTSRFGCSCASELGPLLDCDVLYYLLLRDLLCLQSAGLYKITRQEFERLTRDNRNRPVENKQRAKSRRLTLMPNDKLLRRLKAMTERRP